VGGRFEATADSTGEAMIEQNEVREVLPIRRTRQPREKADVWRKCPHSVHLGHIYCSICKTAIKGKGNEQSKISAATIESLSEEEVPNGFND
jgi:hypothetical protein